MNIRPWVAVLAIVASGSVSFAQSPSPQDDNAAVRPREQTQDRDRLRETVRDRDIYGHQLMTPAERGAYRDQMRSARSQEERDRVRAEHHQRMQERARERGIALPESPPADRGPGPGARPGGAGGGAGGQGR